MYASQKHTRNQPQNARRFQHIQEKLQLHLYMHAEQTTHQKRHFLGYLLVLPSIALTLIFTFGLQQVVEHYIFVDSILVLAFSIMAFWWGVGPALLLLVVGVLILDLFLIAPLGQLELIRWPNVLQLLPLAVTGLVIGLLSFQHDKGWVKSQGDARTLAKTKERIEEEAQRKDQFISITSHELKTPLTSIRMQAQFLQRRLKKRAVTAEDDAILQGLQKIDERTQVLTTMVDELLDLCQIQRQKEIPKRAVLDMNVLCQEVVEEQRLVTSRALLFQESVTPALVDGERHRLTQVVSNLVNNASKYSPCSSPVEVSVDHDGQRVIVQIRDYGQGIEQSQLEHIFEAFYRTPEAEGSATEGLGLGLAIVKQIVELHQGRIWCTSQKGHGSTFYVELPLSSSLAE